MSSIGTNLAALAPRLLGYRYALEHWQYLELLIARHQAAISCSRILNRRCTPETEPRVWMEPHVRQLIKQRIDFLPPSIFSPGNSSFVGRCWWSINVVWLISRASSYSRPRTSSSDANAPCTRVVWLEPGGKYNISPIPSSDSAPPWSRMVRESVLSIR